MAGEKERIAWIDLARVLAIVLIVGFHLAYALNENQALRPIGFVGASLFFIVSGYVLAHRYANLDRFDFGWLKKRYVKIASLYYPALIAMALLFPVDTYYRGPYDLLLHFTFMNWVSHDTAFSIISAAWFIVPLVGLYVLFPFLNRFLRQTPALLFAAFALELANRLIVSDLVSFSPIFFLGEFCLGIALAQGEKRWWVLAAALLPAIVNPVMVIPFAVFLLLWLLRGRMIALPGIVHSVAKNTFEIFLFHDAVIMAALGSWSFYGQGTVVSLAMLALALIAVKLVSQRLALYFFHK